MQSVTVLFTFGFPKSIHSMIIRPVRFLCASHPVEPVRLLRLQCPSRADGVGQLFEHFHRRVPVDAGVRDADAFLERRWPRRRHLLVAFGQVGLDHHAHDARLPFPNLFADDLSDLGLIPVILVGVAFLKSGQFSYSWGKGPTRLSVPWEQSTIMISGLFFFRKASRVALMLSRSKLVPLLPPRRITKPCSFPAVLVIAANPS